MPGPWNTAAQRGYAAKARNGAAAATYDQLARQADNLNMQGAARGSIQSVTAAAGMRAGPMEGSRPEVNRPVFGARLIPGVCERFPDAAL